MLQSGKISARILGVQVRIRTVPPYATAHPSGPHASTAEKEEEALRGPADTDKPCQEPVQLASSLGNSLRLGVCLRAVKLCGDLGKVA